MKVYVVTKAEPFAEEIYVTVKASKKEAEKVVRAEYPNARLDAPVPGLPFTYECHKYGQLLEFMYIHEEEV